MGNKSNEEQAEASRQLVHELRVHQIELELQNEELRRTQAELATARARYFDLYDLAPVGYCTVSATEDILEANLTAASMLGLTCSELVGKAVQHFILPQDQDIYYLHRKLLVDTGQPQSCILRMLRAHGQPFWAQLSATFDAAAAGHAVHRLVLTDVDARKVAQDQARISDVALKAVSQGVLITGPDLHIVSANQAFTTMFGYSQAELQGFHSAGFNGPLTDATALAAFVQAIAARQEFSGEFLNYRKDGSCFWNEVFVSPVLDAEGQLTHFISINTDITERKRLTQVLHDKNLELQLATTLAEKASLAKSDFLSSMSHELRTPLNSILGFAQLLEAGTPAPTAAQLQRIEMIQRSGWYLLTLVNEILDLASIEAGKVALTLEPVAVAGILADCRCMIEPDVQRSGIRVDFAEVSEGTRVIADPVRLKQVIFNLLTNAIKYNRAQGTVEVQVSATTAQTLRISVQDTGLGLSADALAQLFLPFSRLGQEHGAIEGTGIGLVVTRRLTELMGGSVGVHSVEGEGSVFWVELQAARAPMQANAGAPQSGAARAPAGRDGNTECTVLYVEDNLANLDLVSQILNRRPGLKLLGAHNGHTGLALAREQQPLLILMDIDLPDISGLEVLRMLQQDASTRHIPVLAVSANAMPLDISQGLAAGFFRYLTKPFRIDEFLEVLDQALVFADHQTARRAP